MKYLQLFAITLLSTIAVAQNSNDEISAHFTADSLIEEMAESQKRWLAFFKNSNVMTGIYRLSAGSEDQQSPHDTDEIYFVLKGRAKFKVADTVYEEIKAGSILFVKAEATHQFYDISEDLELLVFFDQ